MKEMNDEKPYPFNLPDKEFRAAAKALKSENYNYTDEPRLIPRSQWGPLAAASPNIIEIWRSKSFLVQVHSTKHQGIRRMTVNRTAVDVTNRRWRDGISWTELQDLKLSIGRGDFDAVEIYPAEKDVVNVANMRHLFIFDEPLPYAWRKQ